MIEKVIVTLCACFYETNITPVQCTEHTNTERYNLLIYALNFVAHTTIPIDLQIKKHKISDQHKRSIVVQ